MYGFCHSEAAHASHNIPFGHENKSADVDVSGAGAFFHPVKPATVLEKLTDWPGLSKRWSLSSVPMVRVPPLPQAITR